MADNTNGFSYNSRQEDTTSPDEPGIGVYAPLHVDVNAGANAAALAKALGDFAPGVNDAMHIQIEKNRAQGAQDAQSGKIDPARMENLAYMRGAQSIQAQANFHTNVEKDVTDWMSNTGKYAPAYNDDGSLKTPASGYDPSTMTSKDVLAHTQQTYKQAYQGLSDPVVIKSVLPLMDDLEQRNIAVAQKNDVEVQRQRTISAMGTNLEAQLDLLTPTARNAIATGAQPAGDFIDLNKSYADSKGVMDFHTWSNAVVGTLAQYSQTHGTPEVMQVLHEPLKVDGPANGIVLANSPDFQQAVTEGTVFGIRQQDRTTYETLRLQEAQQHSQSQDLEAQATLAVLNGEDASKWIAKGVSTKGPTGDALFSGETVTRLAELAPKLQTAQSKGAENSESVNATLSSIIKNPDQWSPGQINDLFAKGSFGTGTSAQEALKTVMNWYTDAVKGKDNPQYNSPDFKATQATLDAHYKSLGGIQSSDDILLQANANKEYLDNVLKGMPVDQARDAAMKKFPPLGAGTQTGQPPAGAQVSPADRLKSYAQGAQAFATGSIDIDKFRQQYPDVAKNPQLISQLTANKSITLQQANKLLRALANKQ